MTKQPKAEMWWAIKFDIGTTVAYRHKVVAEKRLLDVKRNVGLSARLVPVLITPVPAKKKRSKR